MRGEKDVRAICEFIDAINNGHTALSASRLAGVNETTPYAWARTDPEVKEALNTAARRRMTGIAAGAAAAAASPLSPPQAVLEANLGLPDKEVMRLRKVGLKTLEEIAKNKKLPAGHRVTAAKALAEMGERWVYRGKAQKTGPAAPTAKMPDPTAQPEPADPEATVQKWRVVQ